MQMRKQAWSKSDNIWNIIIYFEIDFSALRNADKDVKHLPTAWKRIARFDEKMITIKDVSI